MHPCTYLSVVIVALFQMTMASSRNKTETRDGIIIVLAPFVTLLVTNTPEGGSNIEEEGKEQKGGENSLVQHDWIAKYGWLSTVVLTTTCFYTLYLMMLTTHMVLDVRGFVSGDCHNTALKVVYEEAKSIYHLTFQLHGDKPSWYVVHACS